MAWTLQNGVGIPTLITKAPFGASTSIDQVSLTSDQPIEDPLLNQLITAFPFTSLHAEGSSRGVGYNFAIIDCQ